MLRTLRDWACSIVFVVVFAVAMLVFDVALRISSLFGIRAESRMAGWVQRGLLEILRICDIRLEVDRSPEVQEGASYVVVANHQSMFDMPIYGSVFASNFPKYISKVELSKWIPTVSFHLRSGGHALIDRKNRDSAVKAIEKLGHEIEANGFSAVIFPEGTRARKGEIKPFKPAGTVALLRRTNVPVVPVCVDESWRIMEHALFPLPFGVRLKLWIGDPIERRPGDDPYEIVAECERRIRDALGRIRGVELPPPAPLQRTAEDAGRWFGSDGAVASNGTNGNGNWAGSGPSGDGARPQLGA
ncbi:MAG: lysophospholipid acyltransferase family protein [Alphaproteobacteria bacterium]